MFNWLTKSASTTHSKLQGKGTFAKKLIKKDEIIAIFGGYILDPVAWEKIEEDVGSLVLPITKEFVIGPKSGKEAEDADFVNHSCDPNAGIFGQIILVAIRDILPGEEITFDYAMVLADISDEDCAIECQCKKKNCRKLITANDWKNKVLQKKYKGYFSHYIQKKIDLQK